LPEGNISTHLRAIAPGVQSSMTDDRAAARYHRLQLVLGMGALVAGLAYLLGVLVSGAAETVARVAGALTAAWWAQVLLVALTLAVGYRVLIFPLVWVRGYELPRRYGLLHQPFTSWLFDGLKAALIATPLALGGLLAVYALLRVTPHWWLWAAAVFLAASVVMAAVLPVWIMPLFYKLTPLADGALHARLLALAGRAGVPAVGVWVADQSRKSRTANAALVGLGRTRRIVLFDTLVREFAPAEIESVLAHELGHHVHGDMLRGILAQGALTLATFWVAHGLLARGPALWGYATVDDVASIPWLVLVLGALGVAAAPLANAFSRRIEREADDFALRTTRDPAAFVGAMERLAALNLAQRAPSRLKEILLYSHPSLERRMARAREWAHRQDAGLGMAPTGS
jgi:STE24 endopeptidase